MYQINSWCFLNPGTKTRFQKSASLGWGFEKAKIRCIYAKESHRLKWAMACIAGSYNQRVTEQWLLMIQDYTTQYIGDCNNPIGEPLSTNQYSGMIEYLPMFDYTNQNNYNQHVRV